MKTGNIFSKTQLGQYVLHHNNSDLQTALVFKPSTLLFWKKNV